MNKPRYQGDLLPSDPDAPVCRRCERDMWWDGNGWICPGCGQEGEEE